MMMTRKILSGLILFSFFACNQVNKEQNSASIGATPMEEHVDAKEAHSAKLALNKGSKWNTDESTRFHAANLNTAIEAFNKKKEPGVDEYHSFAAELQTELGALLKACRMKGADHEALHLWLGPVMKHTADLKSVTTAEDGKQVTEQLSADIQKFNQYFQNAD
jgi:hypothetical protein